MAKGIMFQGTSSDVGKSILTAAFCRILKQDGFKVVPFKSQNMALNSFITKEGLEMGRAQVFQAEAAGLEPDVRMNPILLKPTTHKKSQVIINGKVYEDMNASNYFEFKPRLKSMISDIYYDLTKDFDIALIEGAGSPAEINLKKDDIVNMGMAKISDSDVILIGDIDRGGVFASIYGTIKLLEADEQKRIKGVIINKFRGDIKILEPGIKMLEDLIDIPVLGVIPFMDVNIEDEDGLSSRFKNLKNKNAPIKIEVVYLPHISNFTDFNVFETQEDVDIRYIRRGEDITNPDLLLLPGSKNTIEDLIYLRESGLEKQILDYYNRGGKIFGICGGYQILGSKIYDPLGVECGIKEIDGLNLLDVETNFEGQKVTTQVKAKINNGVGILKGLKDVDVYGYEIHMGRTKYQKDLKSLDTIYEKLNKESEIIDGAISPCNRVYGTYIHGIFDNINFTRGMLNNIRKEKGLKSIESGIKTFGEFKEREYDKMASIVRNNVDIKKLYQIIGLENPNKKNN